MRYIVESSLWNFPAWSGGKDTLDVLKEKNDVDAVEAWISDGGADDVTDTQINDILWFERDWIAEGLGYKDWDAYEAGISNSDVEDADSWFSEIDDYKILEAISGYKVEEYDVEWQFVDAVQEWWDSLPDEKRVEIYYQND